MISRRIHRDQSDLLTIEELFKRYYPRLFEFAYHLLKNEEEAEDLVQDAFVVFWEQRAHISLNDQAIKAYLYTTIKHDALNRIRHGKVIENYQRNYPPILIDEKQVIDELIHAEVLGELMEALEKLPKGCSMVCRLGYLEGLKNPQIAELMGLSIHTVKSQKQRALTLLKQQLKPELFAVLVAILSR